MCTVSYILSGEGFFLTSNRDESPKRATKPPKIIQLSDTIQVMAPVDVEKGGSWIATDGKLKVACLLNGAFEKHVHELPYAKSRGHFVFEAFLCRSFTEYMGEVELANIEPFTLILIDDFIQVLVWDGRNKNIQFLSKNIPHLWSSATLYSREGHKKKEQIFERFLKDQKIGEETILELHGLKKANDFVLNKPMVKTVSTTLIHVGEQASNLTYLDRVNNLGGCPSIAGWTRPRNMNWKIQKKHFDTRLQ